MPSKFPSEEFQWIAEVYATGPDIPGELRELLEGLVHGTLSQDQIDERIAGAPWNPTGLLDAILVHARHALVSGRLSKAELAELFWLKKAFRIEKGVFYAERKEAVARLLELELAKVLEDEGTDPSEAFQRVALQELLDLETDQVLELTKPHRQQTILRLAAEVSRGPDDVPSPAELEGFTSAMAKLDTAYHRGTDVRQGGGYVCLQVNPALSGTVRIAQTREPPWPRAGRPPEQGLTVRPFAALFAVWVPDPTAGESYVHEVLDAWECRVEGTREYFRIAPTGAIRVMLAAEAAQARAS